jgi:hypothetical protein
MVTAIVLILFFAWAIAVWGKYPTDRNGRVDR